MAGDTLETGRISVEIPQPGFDALTARYHGQSEDRIASGKISSGGVWMLVVDGAGGQDNKGQIKGLSPAAWSAEVVLKEISSRTEDLSTPEMKARAAFLPWSELASREAAGVKPGVVTLAYVEIDRTGKLSYGVVGDATIAVARRGSDVVEFISQSSSIERESLSQGWFGSAQNQDGVLRRMWTGQSTVKDRSFAAWAVFDSQKAFTEAMDLDNQDKLQVESGSRQLDSGDVVAVMSDGVADMLSPRMLALAVRVWGQVEPEGIARMILSVLTENDLYLDPKRDDKALAIYKHGSGFEKGQITINDLLQSEDLRELLWGLRLMDNETIVKIFSKSGSSNDDPKGRYNQNLSVLASLVKEYDPRVLNTKLDLINYVSSNLREKVRTLVQARIS